MEKLFMPNCEVKKHAIWNLTSFLTVVIYVVETIPVPATSKRKSPPYKIGRETLMYPDGCIYLHHRLNMSLQLLAFCKLNYNNYSCMKEYFFQSCNSCAPLYIQLLQVLNVTNIKQK